ncbi:MAG: hypothetical protein D6798_17225 [Deltaproteobacteria bacterium]|nr:MAG: hypothetical protein D6798_17225 [Deltaproteobacteria bacterium]
MPTLRQRLAAAPPPVSMKQAWRAWLRAARAARRQDGVALRIGDRAALERVLDRDPEVDPATLTEMLTEIKTALRDLVHGELEYADRHRLARFVDEALGGLAPRVVDAPVAVQVSGWPEGLTGAQRAAIVGESLDRPLAPGRAAALVAALDGLCLGGSTLRVEVALPAGASLPPVPRALRNRSPRGTRAWLPHLDAEGRRSLTDRALATRQAAWLGRASLIDAFCGCGGNAIAAALAGHRVVAIERDPGRAALARRNASALGVGLEIVEGDAAVVLPGLLDRFPDAGLLLDPPWGGAGSGRRPVRFDGLVPLPPDLVARAPAVLLKAPPALSLDSLPPRWRWRWRFELSPPAADGRAVVLALSCRGIPR